MERIEWQAPIESGALLATFLEKRVDLETTVAALEARGSSLGEWTLTPTP